MKDIKVIVGPDTGRLGDDHRSLTPATLVVRNQDSNGRRLGIFTRDGKAVAGQQLNHADALHTPKEVLNVPQGYGSGVEVNLSPKRDYFKVFDISQSWVPEQHLAGFRQEMYREDGMDDGVSLHVSDIIPDLTKLRTTLPTGDMTIGAEKGLTALNSFVSFTLVFGGRDYHIGLDLAKHPAHVTADLNYRLNRIHPQLRGFVNTKPTADWEYREIEFHITPPDGLEVIFPITTFGVVEDLSVETPQGRTFKSVHLNAQLSNAIMVTKAKGIQAVSNTVTTVDANALRSSLSAMLDNPYLVSLDTFGKEVEGTLELHTGMVTVPASAFRTWDRDERLCFSILKLERKYVDGKAYRIQSIKYVDENGRALPFDEEHADLFLLRGVDEEGLPTVPAVFINDILEREVDELDGYSAPAASQIQFAESGGLNEDNAAAYIALFPRPSEDNCNSIFFRNSSLATHIQIQYVLDYVDELPQVKMNDFGRLDYHRIKTEDHGFLPVSFTAKPITGWGLEFVVEGQEERYPAHKLEHDEETNSTLMLTHGTVGEAVVLSDLDYSQVLAPTVDIPFYHLYDEIGAQTWLNFNLLPTGVVTSTATLSEKARFEVVFPRTEMVTTIEHITQTLIANEVEGEVLLKGKMANASYTIQPHVHALTTEWSFTINGTSVTPTRAVDFNKSTGEWSVPIAIADLVASGPGDYTLRVSLAAEYPWLASPEVYSVPLLFVVLSSVQGVEDDIAFVTPELFDRNYHQDIDIDSRFRVVDLDTDELLAGGDTLTELLNDAKARGLVSIDVIMSEWVEEEPLEISCEGALPEVELEATGQWQIEIDGELLPFTGTLRQLSQYTLKRGVEITELCEPNGVSFIDLGEESYAPEALGSEAKYLLIDLGDGELIKYTALDSTLSLRSVCENIASQVTASHPGYFAVGNDNTEAYFSWFHYYNEIMASDSEPTADTVGLTIRFHRTETDVPGNLFTSLFGNDLMEISIHACAPRFWYAE